MRTTTFKATLVLSLIATAACGKKEEPAVETPATPAAAAAPTVADFAGKWNTTAILGGKDTVASTMEGSADGTTWTMSLTGRPNIPLTVSMVGDSLVTQSAEYESVLRKGVMVTVRTAGVKSGETLTGNMVATYKSASGEQVVNGTFTSTKAP